MCVSVVPHDPSWSHAFARESKAISRALGKGSIGLHHIGSRSIPGILAKPIIDILGVVANLEGMDNRDAVMGDLGYEVMGAHGIAGRRFFQKFDGAGLRSHHLHVFAQGSYHIERHLAFRDFLRSHPTKAAAYSDLKAEITSDGVVSREAYMDAKDPFIAATEKQVVEWYGRIR